MNEKNVNDEIEIDLLELAQVVLRKWWIVILCAVLAGSAGFAVSAFLMTPKYVSSTSVYVMSKQDESKLSYSDTQLSTQLTKDYEELIVSRYVLETVINNCQLEDTYEILRKRVTVANTKDTRIISISVKDASPAMAQYIANSIREIAAVHIKEVTAVEAVNIVDEANLPTDPVEPSIKKFTALGIAAGAFVAIAIILIQYLMDDTLKSSEDVEKYLGLSTLALIPIMEAVDDAGNVIGGKKPTKKVQKKEVKKEA